MFLHYVVRLHVHMTLLQCCSIMWEVCMYTWGCLNGAASSGRFACTNGVADKISSGTFLYLPALLHHPWLQRLLNYVLLYDKIRIRLFFVRSHNRLFCYLRISLDRGCDAFPGQHRLPLGSSTPFHAVMLPFPYDSLYVSISCQHSLLFQHTQDNQLIRKKELLWLLVSEYIHTWFRCIGPVVAK